MKSNIGIELTEKIKEEFGRNYLVEFGSDYINVRDIKTSLHVEFYGEQGSNYAFASAEYFGESYNYDLGLNDELRSFICTVKGILRRENKIRNAS